MSKSEQTLERLARQFNPKIRGWINYYAKFAKQEGLQVFNYLNDQIEKWIGRKYKIESYSIWQWKET